MAQKKKKKQKGRASTQLSPINYIKSRARTLPLGPCYITENWEESRNCCILVTRKHVNGHTTMAAFDVDLNCRGVSDAFWHFNVAPDAYDAFFKEFVAVDDDVIPCDYGLIHNIIYGAVEYAEDYGFSPHKEWKTAQYVLEEDTEDIPFIEIEFGDDGIPMYVPGPNDTPAQQQKIIQTLEQTAGRGGYYYINSEEIEAISKNPGDYDWSIDDIFHPGDLKRIEAGKQQPNALQILLLVLAGYQEIFPDYPHIDLSDDDTLQLCIHYDSMFSDNEYKHKDALLDLLDTLERTPDKKQQLKRLKDYRHAFGDHPAVLELIYNETLSAEEHISMDIAATMVEDFPDCLRFRFIHAITLMMDGQIQEAGKLLGEPVSLSQYAPQRAGRFSVEEYVMFNCAMSLYSAATEAISDALEYAIRVIAFYIEEENELIETTLLYVSDAVQEALLVPKKDQ